MEMKAKPRLQEVHSTEPKAAASEEEQDSSATAEEIYSELSKKGEESGFLTVKETSDALAKFRQ